MRNTIYVVEFKSNPLLNGNFDFKEEAIEWAEDHISEKPVVIARDIEFPDEFGAEPIVYEEEEIFHYPVEEVSEAEPEDDLDARLATIDDEFEGDKPGYELHKDMPQFESVEIKEEIEDVRSALAAFEAGLDAGNTGVEEELDEDFVLFDPFSTDFSECEPMEVCKDEHRADCAKDICASPADFLRELAAELGIADEVEISEKECADDSCTDSCKTCDDEISEISDDEKKDVIADEAPEADVPVEIPEADPVSTDEDGVEKPAKEIAKCPVCPKCGKEANEILEKGAILYKKIYESLHESKEELEAVIAAPGVKCTQELHYAEDGTNVSKEDKVITYDEDQNKDLKKLVESLNSAEAAEFFDLCDELGIKTAEDLKNWSKENPGDVLPTMRAYRASLGKDFKIADNERGRFKDESLEDTVDSDLSDVRTPAFSEEPELAEPFNANDMRKHEAAIDEDEMSDVELAEKLYKALEEKHCKK